MSLMPGRKGENGKYGTSKIWKTASFPCMIPTRMPMVEGNVAFLLEQHKLLTLWPHLGWLTRMGTVDAIIRISLPQMEIFSPKRKSLVFWDLCYCNFWVIYEKWNPETLQFTVFLLNVFTFASKPLGSLLRMCRRIPGSYRIPGFLVWGIPMCTVSLLGLWLLAQLILKNKHLSWGRK